MYVTITSLHTLNIYSTREQPQYYKERETLTSSLTFNTPATFSTEADADLDYAVGTVLQVQ